MEGVRFIDHETIIGPRPKDWKDLHQTITIEAHDISMQPTANLLVQVIGMEMQEGTNSTLKLLDNMFFWWPAQEALENGGCRQ